VGLNQHGHVVQLWNKVMTSSNSNMHSLNTYLPKPKPAPTPLEIKAPAHGTNNDPPAPVMDSINNMILLAQNVIQSTVERNDREQTTANQIPETLLHQLLRLSSLTWDERTLLVPIWHQLYQQPDKAAKETMLRSFFQTLGTQVLAFNQFRNSFLFEHILHHKFEPGPS
jgi:hypothetical protein